MDHGWRTRHGSAERVIVASLIGRSTRLAREGMPGAQAVVELREAATLGRTVRVDLAARARGWHEARAARGWPDDKDSPRAIALLIAAGATDEEIVEAAKREVEEAINRSGHSAPTSR